MNRISRILIVALTTLFLISLTGCTTIDTPIGKIRSFLGAKSLQGLTVDVKTTNGTHVVIGLEGYDSDNTAAAEALGKAFDAVKATADAVQ